MRCDVVSIFPEYFAPLQLSLVGKAIAAGLVELGVHDLRTWTHDRHRTVDDTPYGGGAGMVMKPEPWGEALDTLVPADVQPPLLVVPSPAGVPFSQALAQELSSRDWLLFGCGRYEGIDARVVEHAAGRMEVLEVSLGDYVLNGGEVAVLAIIEAVVRLLPGVLGNPESLAEESHGTELDGLLEYPVYTKPATWRGLEVPAVLLSGHHQQVARWRAEQSLARTRLRRPDLLPEAIEEGPQA
ncbi:MAG: tRNA (guanosine(37)-N1)-methyltransferase TrmD [Propionicimonas sp.]|uniref:tRNA (guanosine(37)-N1)-methyltransferase TrmD n=1 Tax=Propionicimonas sp. TaxID=1955623 RepID=UPI002B1FD850|nr:tRNA (guanosine(37)-N1)-methyltransferase TrmD [Propionicimonas sp.]MEA4944296.1 tRNA (guanosine(37)-N1)-methyltransferase TrmD [Propionicimonas sp.]MEA5054544.1 tRNA (guanosine(37)-N1)-methyltransferase TrmD [Propionicimonas sp.]